MLLLLLFSFAHIPLLLLPSFFFLTLGPLSLLILISPPPLSPFLELVDRNFLCDVLDEYLVERSLDVVVQLYYLLLSLIPGRNM